MKPKYNQGDLLQCKWSDGSADLLVIIGVSDIYEAHWFSHTTTFSRALGINTHDINYLDDAEHVTLLVRGQ